MPIPEQYRDVVLDLIAATKAGRVLWIDSKRFGAELTFQGTTIKAWEGLDESETPYAALGLYDSVSDKLIDSFATEATDEDYKLLSELVERATRAAKKIDVRLEGLRKALKGKDLLGEQQFPF